MRISLPSLTSTSLIHLFPSTLSQLYKRRKFLLPSTFFLPQQSSSILFILFLSAYHLSISINLLSFKMSAQSFHQYGTDQPQQVTALAPEAPKPDAEPTVYQYTPPQPTSGPPTTPTPAPVIAVASPPVPTPFHLPFHPMVYSPVLQTQVSYYALPVC